MSSEILKAGKKFTVKLKRGTWLVWGVCRSREDKDEKEISPVLSVLPGAFPAYEKYLIEVGSKTNETGKTEKKILFKKLWET